MAGVILVVGCTKRKSHPPLSNLSLGGVGRGAAASGLARQWTASLSRSAGGAEAIPAADLYSGSGWSTVRSALCLPERAALPVRGWVCSAGYGLIPFDAPVLPYSATFAPGDPDSVTGPPFDPAGLRAWWRALGSWAGPVGGPRSLAALITENPKDFVLLALSKPYLAAVADDLCEAITQLSEPERLAIVSVGSDGSGFAPHHLQARSSLQSLTGGALAMLNVRLAHRLLAEAGSGPITLAWCRSRMAAWLRTCAASSRPKRDPLTDQEVRAYIRKSLSTQPGASPTPLLRRLRETGKACEQGRFAELFRQVRG